MNTEILGHTSMGYGESHTDIFKVLPTPCIVLGVDSPVFTIIEVNEAFKSVVGLSENNLIGKGFFDAFADNTDFDSHNWSGLIETAILKRIPIKIPLIKYNRNFSADEFKSNQLILLGSIAAAFHSDGLVGRLVCSFTDVTEIRSAEPPEKALPAYRTTKLLEETQRIAKVGSWEANLTDNTIVWSDLTKEIHEVGPDFSPSFEDVIAFFKKNTDSQAFISLVETAIENGHSFDSEMQITTARGNERWIRITGQAEYTAGHCNRVYGAVQDITEKRNTEHSLTESRNQLQSLIQSVNGIFWEADAQEFEFSFVSDHVKDILGYTPEQWLGERYFWENHIHPDDLQQTVTYCQFQINACRDHTFDYRMIKADGSIIWIKDVISVIVEEGRPTCLRGLMVDITETKRIEELSVLEKSILERNTTNDTTLHELLTMYLRGIETIFPGMQCSLHKVKENCLELAFAPSISQDYLQALYNLPIGPSVGSCGTAAFLKERVIVADIANDPKWASYAELALSHNCGPAGHYRSSIPTG